jgi:hypothetical protein
MSSDGLETFDAKGKTGLQPVRFRTEKSVGFPQVRAKFRDGQRHDSTGAA